MNAISISVIIVVVLSLILMGLTMYFLYLKSTLAKTEPQPARATTKTNDRQYIFDFSVVDPDTFISRPIKAKITIKNIDLFLSPAVSNSPIQERQYISPVSEDLVMQQSKINYMGINQETVNYEVDSRDELQEEFYEIKNKFFLLDPFLTSGKDMVITDQMKANFTNILNKKSKLKDAQTSKH